MILEWVDRLRTPATLLAKRWGYTTQSVALKFRARRCRKHWQEHLSHSKSFILEFLQKSSSKRLTILGSGHLLEIPIQEILQQGIQVTLVDLVHPRHVRALARRYPQQVQLIEKDLSSVLSSLQPKMKASELLQISWDSLPGWDLPKTEAVVSANLLSQIPLIISESIKMTSQEYEDFARKIRDLHIQRMLEIAPKAALFADFETHYVDRQGKRLDKETYEVNLRDLRKTQEWLWEISPYGEASPHYRVDMHVRAYWKF